MALNAAALASVIHRSSPPSALSPNRVALATLGVLFDHMNLLIVLSISAVALLHSPVTLEWYHSVESAIVFATNTLSRGEEEILLCQLFSLLLKIATLSCILF